MKLLMIADDLTGTLDTAVQFAKAGAVVRICVRRDLLKEGDWTEPETEVLAVNTESRHLPPAQAAEIVSVLCRKAAAYQIPCVYKKTDSALRGNVGAEILAAAEALGISKVPLIPAYPKLGRITRDGKVYINGIPLEDTALAKDPFNPIGSSVVTEILNATEPGASERIRVYEASTDEDLKKIGEKLGGELRCCAGCGGYAEILAGQLFMDRKKEDILQMTGPMLVVNGSLHETSVRQTEYAKTAGIPVRMLSPEYLYKESSSITEKNDGAEERIGKKQRKISRDENSAEEDLTEQICENLRRCGICVVTTGSCGKSGTEGLDKQRNASPKGDPEEQIDRQMNRQQKEQAGSRPEKSIVVSEKKLLTESNTAKLVRRICEQTDIRTLCISGGDTLAAVLKELSCGTMSIKGEVFPGIICSEISFGEPKRSLGMISKAGSFGGEELIAELCTLLGIPVKQDRTVSVI